jgi:hypothetical protein
VRETRCYHFVDNERVDKIIKCAVKPVNKGHTKERLNVAFKDKWSLFGGFFYNLFNQKWVKDRKGRVAFVHQIS